MKTIKLFLLFVLVICVFPAFAQKKKAIKYAKQEAKAYANEGAKIVTAKLKEYLNPEELGIGMFPNTDGFMDAKFLLKKNYLSFLSSGIDADYTSRSESSEVKDVSESETLTREVIAKLNAVNFQMPLELGSSVMLGINASINGIYLYNRSKSSGYKKVQDGTIYFNQKKNIHNVSPVVDVGITGVLTQYFSFKFTGGYTPLVFIKETGKKNYSTYDNPITYEVNNYNSSINAEVSLKTHNLGFGDIELTGRFIRFFGNYQTHQELILGNYKTTIKTFSSFKKDIIEGGLYYRMTFLKSFTKYVPILSLIYSKNLEMLDGSTLSDESLYKVGVIVAVE